MKYTRIEVNPGPFADILPKGAKIYERHKLPTIEFKKNGVEYTISDLTLLNPIGVSAFENVLNCLASGIGNEAKLRVDSSVTDDDLDIVYDIVTGFAYDVKKKGKNGYRFSGARLIHSMTTEKRKDGRFVTFTTSPEIANDIHEYAEANNYVVNLIDMIVYIAEKEYQRFKEAGVWQGGRT